MDEEEAMGYLHMADMTRLHMTGGDAMTEAAVVAVCRSNRDTVFLLPTMGKIDLASKPREVISFYASKYFANAAKSGDVKKLGEALSCLEASNLRAVDRHKASAMLDHYIIMVGTIRAERALLEASRRTTLSDDGRALIHDRIQKLK